MYIFKVSKDIPYFPKSDFLRTHKIYQYQDFLESEKVESLLGKYMINIDAHFHAIH